MKLITLLAVFHLLISLVACDNAGTTSDCNEGSGIIIFDTLKTEVYSSVLIESRCNIYFKQAETMMSILETDDNIRPMLNILTGSQLLKITPTEFICPTRFNLYLSMPEVNTFRMRGSGTIQNQSTINSSILETIIEGSGDVVLADVHTEFFSSKIVGSGNIHSSGTTDICAIEVFGSGNISIENLAAREVVCTLEGSGNIRVNARESLTIRILGNGNVYYKGNPSKLDVIISGSGSIEKIP